MHQSYPDSLPFSSAQAFFAQFECAPLSSIIRRGVNKYVIVQTDGACRGNPGPAATGIVILDGTSSQTIAEFGSKLGHATNNEAEYQALLEAVKWLLERKALLANDVQIHFYLDSELVVKQSTGVFRINGLRLRELAG